ncbi:MAG TPA: hydroxymethylbilane synthase [Planctomycetota bacterium]|nr:hydroxymethylbilane synthase [Planctomycetota bacterium]
MPAPFRVGSRASLLARTQTEWIAGRLGDGVALVWIRSEGDADTTRPLSAMGGTGVFTAALHQALREDRCDAAVHSLKDLPVAPEAGVVLGAVPVREDARDALLSRGGETLEGLRRGAVVATGSPRRAAQLLRARPDLAITGLRGNVDTRLRRLKEGAFDAMVLAVAGLKRLGRDDEIAEMLAPEVMLPAAGQGALAITIREGDTRAEDRVRRVADVRAAAAVTAERAALHGLSAGCHAPVGALAEVADGVVRLRVRVLSLDGRTALEETGSAGLAEADALGHAVAESLLARGAAPLVAAT